jgi:hypothetical protein
MSKNPISIPNISSSDIVYSEHDYDECFEYKDGSGRVPDGIAIGYEQQDHDLAGPITKLYLFHDVQYSKYDHQYWNNYELENDVDRITMP